MKSMGGEFQLTTRAAILKEYGAYGHIDLNAADLDAFAFDDDFVLLTCGERGVVDDGQRPFRRAGDSFEREFIIRHRRITRGFRHDFRGIRSWGVGKEWITTVSHLAGQDEFGFGDDGY